MRRGGTRVHYPHGMSSVAPLPIELVDAFGVGVYLLMLITHADLGWHRRDRPAHFWLALSAFGALMVNVTGAINRHLQGTADDWLLALNALGVTAALVSLYELVQTLRRQRSSRAIRVVQASLLLPVLLLPLWSHAMLAPMLYGASALFLIAAMVQAFRHAWSGDAESRVMTTGLIVLFATLIYDMTSELGLLPRVEGMPILGFTVLYFAAARALSLRYDREYRELVDLRGELESRVQQRTTDLEVAVRQLDALSRTDPLTGLANRRSFIASASARLQQGPISLIMIDLDHFKRINDAHGHDVGDAALRAVAEALNVALGDRGMVARWGGEEFIVWSAVPDAQALAESLRSAIAAIVLDIGDPRLQLTASLGRAECRERSEFDACVAAADRALYRAKRQGRNCVVQAAD